MSKKLIKVLTVIMIILMLSITVSNFAYAVSPEAYKGTTNFSGASKIGDMGNKVIGAVQIVGTIVAVAILIVLGIKYMMGSAEEKAEYKKTMLPYLIGAVIVFAASILVKWVYDLAKGL